MSISALIFRGELFREVTKMDLKEYFFDKFDRLPDFEKMAKEPISIVYSTTLEKWEIERYQRRCVQGRINMLKFFYILWKERLKDG